VFRTVASITTNIAHLTLEKFQESRFPLPPTVEQERIVLEMESRLSVADAIEKQMIAELRRIARLRQAILKWGFEGKLVDQDPNDELAETLLARVRAERAAVPAKKANSRRRGAA
jgi:type I restriction enzyme S subunit